MRGQDTVLCIQDGTDLNFATRPHCLGIIGRNQTASKTLGLHLPDPGGRWRGSAAGRAALRFRGAAGRRGTPGGRATAGGGAGDGPQGGAGDGPQGGQETAPKTQRWVDWPAALSRKTRVISVMDRDGLLRGVRRDERVEVLVRAHHDRCLAKGAPKLFAAMRAGAADGHVEIEIDRLSARRKSSGRQARPARTGRVARRGAPVVAPPRNRWRCQRSMCAKPRRRPCGRAHQPRRRQHRNRGRGHRLLPPRIDLFRVLSPDAESNISRSTADRLQRAVTINTVIAWRLMVMTLLGRDVPGCDAQLLFTDIELRFLTDYAEELGLPPPDHLAAAVLLLAIFGGYQNHARPAPRTPDHVARLRTNVHRNHRLPHWTAGACWSCPERIMWVQGRASLARIDALVLSQSHNAVSKWRTHGPNAPPNAAITTKTRNCSTAMSSLPHRYGLFAVFAVA